MAEPLRDSGGLVKKKNRGRGSSLFTSRVFFLYFFKLG